MKFLGLDHPFFKPLWIRIAVVSVCATWGIVEFMLGAPFWGALFLVLGAVSFYGLFIDFNPREPDEGTAEKSTAGDEES